MKRTLIIDCQSLQSPTLHRGIGKYTVALLHALSSLKKDYDQLVLLFNHTKIDNSDQIELDRVAKKYKKWILPLTKTNYHNHCQYSEFAEENRAIIEREIDNVLSGHEVDFLIMSLFQGEECAVFPGNTKRKMLLMYDLIPLQFPQYYLKDSYGEERPYLSRFKELFKADHFFTISVAVANDLALHLGIPAERITPILGAYIKRKGIIPKKPRCIEGVSNFILMPTGDDFRKNNRRAAIAFDNFNTKVGGYKLVITSFFSKESRKKLSLYCNDLIFSGNVTDAELAWLYEHSAAVLFMSECEGLGMPPIEAVEFGRPVICSDIDVFKEINEDAFYFCDPYSPDSISQTIQAVVLQDERQFKKKKKHYAKILKKYDWDHTARKLLASIPAIVPRKTTRRKKIAVFAPIPSGYSAIGKVVQEQHYQLSEMCDIDYYLEAGVSERAKQAAIRPNYLKYVANTYNPWSLDEVKAGGYDTIVYHIGNSEYHLASMAKAQIYPGTVIIHDTDIHGLYEVARNNGFIDTKRLEAEERLEAVIVDDETYKKGYLASIVNSNHKIVMHSDYAKSQVERVLIHNGTVIRKVNLSTATSYKPYKYKTETKFVIGFAGIIHEAKGLELVAKVSHRQYAEGKGTLVKIFGFSLIDKELESKLGSYENVELVERPSDTRFIHELTGCDVVINFRPNYHGETSLSTLEALRLGKPVVVNKLGWFNELPDELVYKVDGIDRVSEAIARATEDTEALQAKRRNFIKLNFSIAGYLDTVLE